MFVSAFIGEKVIIMFNSMHDYGKQSKRVSMILCLPLISHVKMSSQHIKILSSKKKYLHFLPPFASIHTSSGLRVKSGHKGAPHTKKLLHLGSI
jgi:hypothetical protein